MDTLVTGDLALAVGVDESGEFQVMHLGTPWFRRSVAGLAMPPV